MAFMGDKDRSKHEGQSIQYVLLPVLIRDAECSRPSRGYEFNLDTLLVTGISTTLYLEEHSSEVMK